MVKSILYEGTIALGTSMDSRKDLGRQKWTLNVIKWTFGNYIHA